MSCCEQTIGSGGGFSSSDVEGAPVRKTITFLNSTGVLDLFSVTGDVIVKIVPICKTTLTSAAAANIRLGSSFDDDAMISDTVATLLAADEIWIDTSPDSEIEPLSTMREYLISAGGNVILTLDAQVDTGEIDFVCFWIPVSSDGNVVPA